MGSAVIGIVSSVLAIIIGLWKFFTGKDRAKRKKRQEALDEVREGVKKKDPTRITSGFDRLNRLNGRM